MVSPRRRSTSSRPASPGLLRKRSRAPARDASRGRTGRSLRWPALLILIRSAAYLAIPYLVGLGIDRGIRAGQERQPRRPSSSSSRRCSGALDVNAVANYAFMRLSGRVGADILFDLRRLLFGHVQELSLSFFERYTSGRIISRLTSDIDALNELLATGLTSVLTSLISVVGDHRDPAAPRRPPRRRDAGRDAAGARPDRLVPAQLGALVSSGAAGDRAGDRALRRVARRHPRGARVPARAAQPGDLRGRQRALPRRQHLVEPPGVDVRAGDHPARPADHDLGARVRRVPRRAGPADPGRADRLRPLSAAVLRADAGPVAVLQHVPGGRRGAREARRRDRGDGHGAGAARTGAAAAT